VGAEAGVEEDEEVQGRMAEGDRAPALKGTAHSSPLLKHHFWKKKVFPSAEAWAPTKGLFIVMEGYGMSAGGSE